MAKVAEYLHKCLGKLVGSIEEGIVSVLATYHYYFEPFGLLVWNRLIRGLKTKEAEKNSS